MVDIIVGVITGIRVEGRGVLKGLTDVLRETVDRDGPADGLR